MKLPEYFDNYFKDLMKSDEYEHFKDSFDAKRVQGLRVNTLKIQNSEFIRLSSMALSSIPWITNGFYYEEGETPGKNSYYHAGLYYIQEPSAMMPGLVLSPNKGERVLDLCAAPGGKTTHLGCLMENTGLIVSNDISPKRVKPLAKNIALMGLTNTLVVNETPQRLSIVFPEFFDKILLDVPCSGEGTFRKDKDAIQNYTRFTSTECVAIQREIFQYAYEMLKPGGTLVYSTCTFNPDENERNMAVFINQYGLIADKLEPFGGWEHSRGEWTVNKDETMSNGLRLWPHKACGEGHFVFRLKKLGESNLNERNNLPSETVYTSSEAEGAARSFKEFEAEHMNTDIHGSFHLSGNKLYRLPDGLSEIPRLRWETAGLYLGEHLKYGFEPSQALAMASEAGDFEKVVNLSREDHQVIRYLKGETLMQEGKKGYTAICVDGFPLGWGKQENGGIKNLYQKGWRMM